MAYPFASADTASWHNSAALWGRWQSFDNKIHGLRGTMDMRAELVWYLSLEKRIQGRWRKELDNLDAR